MSERQPTRPASHSVPRGFSQTLRGLPLFWRLLAAFLAAHTLALVAFLLLVRPVLQQLDAGRPAPGDYREHVAALVQTFESSGRRSALRAIREHSAEQRVVATLITPGGQHLARRVPPPVSRIIASKPELLRDRQGAWPLPRGATVLLVTEPDDANGLYRWIAIVPPAQNRNAVWLSLGLRLALALFALALLSWVVGRWLSRPLEQLGDAAKAIGRGDLSARVSGRLSGRADEIGRLSRDFNTMAERTEALLEARNRLVRDVSHELRSPLARLRVALELVRGSVAGADSGAAAHLNRIETETERLDALIEQTLTMARLQGGTAAAHLSERSRIDVADLLRQVVDDSRYEHPDRQIELAADPDCVVSGHAEQLTSAIENVLRNALHYGPTEQPIRVTCPAHDQHVCIAVRDYGPGVRSDELDAIFEPFYRTSQARERRDGGRGHGVGLAIVSQVVRAHGGRVSASLPAGGGLQVTLELPRPDSRD